MKNLIKPKMKDHMKGRNSIHQIKHRIRIYNLKLKIIYTEKKQRKNTYETEKKMTPETREYDFNEDVDVNAWEDEE